MAREGKIDLTEFVANHGPKVCNQVIQTAHELIEATRKLEPAKKTRIELLEESGSSPVEDCHGQWMSAALKYLIQMASLSNGFISRLQCTETWKREVPQCVPIWPSKLR